MRKSWEKVEKKLGKFEKKLRKVGNLLNDDGDLLGNFSLLCDFIEILTLMQAPSSFSQTSTKPIIKTFVVGIFTRQSHISLTD